MSLQIEVKIEPTTLIFQQDPTVEFKITNIGKEKVNIVSPAPSTIMPVVRVTSRDTGVEKVFQFPESPFRREWPKDLEPRESTSAQFNLSERASVPGPGTYDVVLEYDWNDGEGTAKSQPVKLTILPSNPRSLEITTDSGGLSSDLRLLWTNISAEASHLMLTQLLAGRKPRVGTTFQLQEHSDTIPTYLSVPKNRQVATQSWVIWLKAGAFEGFRLTDGAKDGRIVKFVKLPEVPTVIIPPILPLPEVSGDVGASVVLCQTPAGGKSTFQTGIIEPDGKPLGGPASPAQGGTVVWGRATAFSSGERRIYAVAHRRENGQPKLTLQSLAWPAGAQDLKKTGHTEIEGDLVAAAISLNSDDVVHGALLAQVRPASDVVHLGLYPFYQNPDLQLQIDDPIYVIWSSKEGIADGRLAVDDRGEVYGLIKAGDGSWYHFTSEEPEAKPVADPTGSAAGQIDIVLMGMREPAIIYSQAKAGFQFSKLDGTLYAGPASP